MFPSPSDPEKPLNAEHLRFKVWYRVLHHARLRGVRLHDLRHTYASLLLQAGEPVGYVKQQLGHSSIQITVDRYGHFVPGANRSAVDRLAAATDPALSDFDFSSTEDQVGKSSASGGAPQMVDLKWCPRGDTPDVDPLILPFRGVVPAA